MKKKIVIWVTIILILLTPIVWYLASPLFIDEVVNEEFPITNEEPIIIPDNIQTDSIEINKDQMENSTLPLVPLINKTIEQNEVNPIQIYSGVFKDGDKFHKASGEAIVLKQGEKIFLRFENFEVRNGPGLKVYISTELNPKDYISLGDLKGNIGNQNYEINEEIDFEKYDKVLIWCEPFSLLFGSAQLS